MNQSAEQLGRLHTALCGSLERYISRCLELASDAHEDPQYWEKEATFAQLAMYRIIRHAEMMVRSAAGEDVPEIGGKPQDARTITINAGGDAILTQIHDSQNVGVGKDIKQDVQT